MTSYWHPFADMAAVEAAGELSIVRAEGSHIWDADGRRYLDATASLWYCNVGQSCSRAGFFCTISAFRRHWQEC